MQSALSFLKRPIGSLPLFFIMAAFWMVFANFSFFRMLFQDYPPGADNALFLIILTLAHGLLLVLCMTLLCVRYTTKPLLIAITLGAAGAAYFMDTYHIAINFSVIKSAMNTDTRESADLLNPRMFLYFGLLGALPAWAIYHANIVFRPFWQELLLRLKFFGIVLVFAGVVFAGFSAAFSSYGREHRPLRYYFNPTNYIYATGKFVGRTLKGKQDTTITKVGEDAAIPEEDKDRELIIVVVGETARADRFSLNGYAKKTNPLLEKEKVVSFSNVTSCGTYTSLSVPCMFSLRDNSKFDLERAHHTENALDVLVHAGANVLWRDNNSDSKGVATRITYEDWRNPEVNPVCDPECRDVGMLSGLQDYINAHPKGDIVIVLHQMGNHGPAYYKRYPDAFETFKPACRTNELSACSKEELDNAYDNAIYYTDYFLSQVIAFLKKNDERFETAMLYVSDHGESLGENGVYLHSMPNLIAPKEQRHVPIIAWIGKRFDTISYAELKAKQDMPLSHDNIFHTLLGLIEVQSKAYDAAKDIFKK